MGAFGAHANRLFISYRLFHRNIGRHVRVEGADAMAFFFAMVLRYGVNYVGSLLHFLETTDIKSLYWDFFHKTWENIYILAKN